MVDRLYENMLELFSKRQEQDSNSTLCNLKVNNNAEDVFNQAHSNSTLCNLKFFFYFIFIFLNFIVIVHYVI